MNAAAGTPRIHTAAAAIAVAVAAVTACTASQHAPAPRATVRHAAADTDDRAVSPGSPLPVPSALSPFVAGASGQGAWHAAGRRTRGVPAVYVTTLIPPGGSHPAGVAWMDTTLLAARLYSGSISPGGGPYRYTAPVQPAQAATLVAAFNGGFKMDAARGGYVTEGRTIVPLRQGAASLVVYADGHVDIGSWGTDVRMTPNVAAVRQNLRPLVVGARPAPTAATSNWLHTWGNTCGATSCGHTVPGIEHQWRSGAGVTADGALVYVTGPDLDPLQLAELLVRAGAVRGMELDINPFWTVLVTYDPAAPHGPATAQNGTRLLPSTVQGPATFFEPSWARDFVTMSAR